MADCEYKCPAEMEEMEPMRKMFIGNIAKEANDEELKELFVPFGEVAEVKIIQPKEGNKIFGFVTFATVESTDECLLARLTTPMMLQNRELLVKRAIPKEDQTGTAHLKSKKIFFARATPETTIETVREYLEKRHPAKYGKIGDIQMPKNAEGKEGSHKGFGFVHCETEDLCDRIAIAEKKATIIPGTKGQEFKKAEEKGAGGGGRGRGRGGFGGPQRGGRGGGYAAGGYGGPGGHHHGGYGGGYAPQAYGGYAPQAYGGYGPQGYGGYGGYGGY